MPETLFAIPVVIVLRQSLIEVATSLQVQEGQQTKMAFVYQYLTRPCSRHRIDAIVEKFTDLQADLDRERETMMRMWAKREEQLRGVLDSTAGLWGDLQEIAGRAMQEIESLDVPMIEAASAATAKLAVRVAAHSRSSRRRNNESSNPIFSKCFQPSVTVVTWSCRTRS